MNRASVSGSNNMSSKARSNTALKALFVIFSFASLILNDLDSAPLKANESPATLCSARIRNFVKEMDTLLSEDPDSVMVFEDLIARYLPVKACDVDDVILISRESKFFWEVFDAPGYVIVFKSQHFKISFGLVKDTGDIDFPAAMIRTPAL
jgi:hypothetical protein